MITDRKKMTGALFLALLPVLSCDAQAAGSRHRGQDALNTRLARELQAAGQRVSEGVVADIASAQARQRERLRLQLEMDSLRVRMAGTPDARRRTELETQMAALKRQHAQLRDGR
ncbi:TPA: hypothetical protein ACJG67_004686 [Salmonella enterica subsp. enterica serovar Kottbus]